MNGLRALPKNIRKQAKKIHRNAGDRVARKYVRTKANNPSGVTTGFDVCCGPVAARSCFRRGFGSDATVPGRNSGEGGGVLPADPFLSGLDRNEVPHFGQIDCVLAAETLNRTLQPVHRTILCSAIQFSTTSFEGRLGCLSNHKGSPHGRVQTKLTGHHRLKSFRLAPFSHLCPGSPLWEFLMLCRLKQHFLS